MNIKVLMVGAGLSVRGGITSVEKLILEHSSPNYQVQHIGTFAYGSVLHNIKVFFNAIWVLTNQLVKGNIDLVHIHFSERGSTLRKFILALIVLLFRKPLVLHSHGAAYKEFYAGLPLIMQRSILSVFQRCNKFIALSNSWREYFLDAFRLEPDQIVVLYNPVKLPTVVPDRTNHSSITFVFLGRIGKRSGALDLANANIAQQDKGAFDLLSAFAKLPEPYRLRAKLILAGNGDLESAKQLATELNIAAQVTIHSWLTPTQRDTLLETSDVFVLPSYNEGLPMSMLEAMAWGLSVIVTPVGGIPEVIQHKRNGLLVQPGNQSELTSAMQTLIHDDALRLSLGSAARSHCQLFDVQNYVRSLHEIYSSVLNESVTNLSRPKGVHPVKYK